MKKPVGKKSTISTRYVTAPPNRPYISDRREVFLYVVCQRSVQSGDKEKKTPYNVIFRLSLCLLSSVSIFGVVSHSQRVDCQPENVLYVHGG